MLIMVFRKMINKKWMTLCLLIGFVLAVAMVSSIPIYTDGVLQRMLTRDLENYQVSTGFFPGRYIATANLYSNFDGDSRHKALNLFDGKMSDTFPKEIGLPVRSYSRVLSAEYFNALPRIQREEKPAKRTVRITTMYDLEEHIQLVKGRMFSAEKQDGVYEAIVTEYAMQKLDLRLDEEYVLEDFVRRTEEPIIVKVVGIFTVKDAADPYWFQGLPAYDTNLIIDENPLYK